MVSNFSFSRRDGRCSGEILKSGPLRAVHLSRHKWPAFVWQVSYNPNGDLVASASQDRSVRIWNARDGSSVCYPEPDTQIPKFASRNPKPGTRTTEPETRTPKSKIRSPEPEIRNPKPETRNPKPETRNLKHEARNPKPEIRASQPLYGLRHFTTGFLSTLLTRRWLAGRERLEWFERLSH